MKNLRDIRLKGVRVLYRADYNVPIKDGVIKDDFRIRASFETLDYLVKQGAKVIVVSHLGRPDGHEVEDLSLRPVAERLADQYPRNTVRMAHKVFDPEVVSTVEAMKNGDILLLQNIRFYREEEENNERFGADLAAMADVFVLDAFACAHRAHASVVRPAETLPSYPGFLMEKELKYLGELLEKPAHPFAVVMGGAKVSEKIEVIRSLAKQADVLLIGGAMANTFLLAQGEKIGDSKAEPEKRHLAEDLMKELGEKLFLASDYVKDKEDDEHFRYLDIGPKAIEQFKEKLKGAKTIFWNGCLGYVEESPYDTGSKEIAQYLAGRKDATTVIAGGDTAEMVFRLQVYDKITFVSTGGGAALEFLAGVTLPGVAALEK